MTTDTPIAPDRSRRSGLPGLALAFGALFVLSGAAGLTYEVVWSRFLHEIFGVTAFAVSTVLVSFMGGMALGAALFGRRADRSPRPLRMFALLEAGIGIYALLLPVLVMGVDRLYGVVFPLLPDSFLLKSIVRFVLCLMLLLVPTTLMGGTLPALGQGLLRRRDRVGVGVGLLYFVNTFGAAVGCYAAGFVLLPGLGLWTTTMLAAVVNFAVAGTAIVLERGREPAAATSEAPADTPGHSEALTSPASWPLIVAFGSGLTALAFEIVWFRILVLVFGSTVYSFAAMLSVFLLGLAIGSLALGPLADRARVPVRLLAATQGAAALFALAGSLAVNAMPRLFLEIYSALGFTFDGMNRTKLLLSLVTLLPAAIAFGGTFPVAVRLVRSAGGTGSRIGGVYAGNTLGAILGSFGAGFVLLPAVGSEVTLTIVVAVSLLLAFGSLLAEPGPVRAGWALPAGLLIVIMTAALILAPPWNRVVLNAGVFFSPERFFDGHGRVAIEPAVGEFRLDSYTEGYTGMIAGIRSPGGKFININGSTTASDEFEDMFYQRMLAHLPMALHPGRVERVLIVGLGAGVTAGAAGLYDIDTLTAVELEEGVLRASRYFEEENHHVLDNPKLDLRLDDGRNFLKLTDETFDVISSAPNFPSLSGAGALYTTDFFELARRRLAPGGVMCQFVPVLKFLPRDVKTIVGSFSDTFPEVRVFSMGVILVMLGREEPFPDADLDTIATRLGDPPVRASLAEVGVRDSEDLLGFYIFDTAETRAYAEGARRNTDDHPVIEFFSPEGLFVKTVADNLREIQGYVPSPVERAARLGLSGEDGESYIRIAEIHDDVTTAVAELWSEQTSAAMERLLPAAAAGNGVARYYAAAALEKLAHRFAAMGQYGPAAEHYRYALRYVPDKIEIVLGLGHVELMLGRADEARRLAEQARAIHPDSAAAAELLGWVEMSAGSPELAEPLFRRAIELAPWLSNPYALLGDLLLRRGAPEEALANLDAAAVRGNVGEAVLAGRARALLELGRPDEAFEAARLAASVLPGSIEAFEMLERSATAAGHPAVAEDAARRVAELRRIRDASRVSPENGGPGESGGGS